MGIVYEAERDGTPTALKVVSPWLVSEQGRRRFRLEAMACAQLTHPNTVQVFDFGEAEDGTLYCAMELLRGLNLVELVEQHGPQPAGRVLRILSQITGALGEAHDKSFVHRDIKPANIVLTEGDVAKLLDFGLVMPLGVPLTPAFGIPRACLATSPAPSPALERQPLERVTLDEPVMGTPRYTAPEIALGVGSVGPPSDFYALGLVAYFLLAGKHAFDAHDPADILRMQQEMGVPDVCSERPDVSPALARAVAWCLEKAPEARPSSAAELAAALDACPDGAGWTDDDARAWWIAHPVAGASRPPPS
ncbi:MAG: serine/threonine protein kinase [Sandaracinaceae bacterium]|nr:serine/threonine protein kinase [Sandaracinaceae bacterium]